MSGWTALCFLIAGMHVNEPAIGATALLVWLFTTSPNKRIEELERKVRRMEGK